MKITLDKARELLEAMGYEVAEQTEQEPVCECHRKTSAVISSEKDL